MTQTVASASGIVKSFGAGARALDGVDIAIRPGKVTGLVGPDGAGKTTLIRILAGLMTPSEGAVEIFGAAAGAAARRDRLHAAALRALRRSDRPRESDALCRAARAAPRDHEAVFERLYRFTDLDASRCAWPGGSRAA